MFAFWKIQEDDIWWQIRAGDEILRGHPIQRVDEWSYSVTGQPWTNYQWLATVVFRLIWRVAGSNGLIALRVLLVAFWMVAVGCIVGLSVSARYRAAALVALVPWVFYAALFRMHLRPETFGVVLFGALIVLWSLRDSVSSAVRIRRRVLTLVLIGLAANFHAGTAVFLLFVGGLFIAFDAAPKRLGWLAGAVLAYFCTPIGFGILPELARHFSYDNSVLFNTEWQPFSWGHFNVAKQGWSLAFWAISAAAGWFQLLRLWAAAGPNVVGRLPGIYARPVPVFLGGVVLTALALARIRCIPYQVLFFSPILATLFRGRHLGPARAAIVGGALWFWLMPSIVSVHRDLYGFGTNAKAFPVQSAEAIRRMRPEPNLLSSFMSSSYLLWALPEYRDMADPRDVIFNSVKPELVEAYRTGASMEKLTRKYLVQSVLVEVPEGSFAPDGRIQDAIADLFPLVDWAAVYQNRYQALLVKRIPAHERLIADHEYRLLRPGMPPTAYAFVLRKSAGTEDERFDTEYRHCLADDADSVFCRVARAALQIKRQPGGEGATQALALLDEAASRGAEGIHYLSQRMRAYELLGRKDEAERTAQELANWARKREK